jgi:hypothetical protein
MHGHTNIKKVHQVVSLHACTTMHGHTNIKVHQVVLLHACIEMHGQQNTKYCKTKSMCRVSRSKFCIYFKSGCNSNLYLSCIVVGDVNYFKACHVYQISRQLFVVEATLDS